MTTKFSETSISLGKTHWPYLEYNRRVWFTTKSNPGKVFSFLVFKGLAITDSEKSALKLHTSYKKEGDRASTFNYDDITELRIEPTAMEHKLYTTLKAIIDSLKTSS